MDKDKFVRKELATRGKVTEDIAINGVVRPRVLLAISIQSSPILSERIAEGKEPHRDYLSLQQALNADIIFTDQVKGTFIGALMAWFLGKRIVLAWGVFRLRCEYDIVYTDTELVGLPLAVFLKFNIFARQRPRHVTLAHYLSPFKKRILIHCGAASCIDRLIVHSAAQFTLATEKLHIPRERVKKMPYFVDEQFWIATELETEKNILFENPHKYKAIICSSGLEFRDYPTLISAVTDLNVQVYIAAKSASEVQRGSTSANLKASAKLPDLPPNVTVTKLDYTGMRQLYATARFVVLPLHENDFQAGISVILEAMAMGKAVIVSSTRGQTDVIRDFRGDGYSLTKHELWKTFLDESDLKDTLGNLPTGMYVTPGNSKELRESIQYLLDNSELCEELGRNGRRVVEGYFGLNAFTSRFADTILGEQPNDETFCYA